MTLSKLSADELAKIDRVCLAYEAALRQGEPRSIEAEVAAHPEVDAEALREELTAVAEELRDVEGPPVEGPPAETRSDSIFATGRLLGPYRVEGLIGRGGMGRVYRGFDTRLQRPVAIKVLADDWSQHPDRVQRFERESRVVAGIRHPNIVSLFDVGTFRNRPYAVMELLEGETLRARMRREPLEPETIRGIGIQAAEALAAAHGRGIVHRDLKPENLFLANEDSSEGRRCCVVKLVDFGLSRAPEEDAEDREATASGIVMGTAGYMAPEQARGEKATSAADLFSLGCVLHECFYRQSPFSRRSLAESLGAVLHTEPEIDGVLAARDPELAETIAWCLRKDPAERPASAAEVTRWLRGEAASEGITETTIAALGSYRQPGEAKAIRRSASGSGTHLGRRSFGLLALGTCGAAVAGWATWSSAHRDVKLEAIAVLPLRVDPAASRQPIGTRELDDEEKVAALLVSQLARQTSVKVVPYRPIDAAPNAYAELGRELGVDALVFVNIEGIGDQRRIYLQLVQTASGRLLWAEYFPFAERDSLLEQTSHAAVLADRIGVQVDAYQRTGRPEDRDAFQCLVKGHARMDPDSREGLEMGLKCFANARVVDPQVAEAHAGYAIVSISLASVESVARAQALMLEAREAVTEALALEPQGAMANLAAGMLAWRHDRRYDEAEQSFAVGLKSMPNHWQLHHERALLTAVRGDLAGALESIDRAAALNPLSMTLQLEAIRLRWFAGDATLAGVQIAGLLSEPKPPDEARGLAIDMLEQQRDYSAAARRLGKEGSSLSAAEYLAARAATLEKVPYGPWGPALNEAILRARSGPLSDPQLAALIQTRAPVLAFLLAVHPVFAAYRDHQVVREILPPRA